MNEIIATRNLVKNFKDFRAVADISFAFSRGENFAVLDENGDGTSTTVRRFTVVPC